MKQRTASRQWTFEEALTLVCDQSQPLSRPVIAFLSGAGRAEVSRFADCWRRMSGDRHRELIRSMVEMAEADFGMDFVAIFRWALRSEDPQVRQYAIEGLWEDEQPGLIEPLVRMMQEDPDPAVRARAASSLGRFALLLELGEINEGRGARLREGLLHVIGNPAEDTEVRRRAIESVAYLSDAPVRQIIEAAYASSDERMRLSAVFAMGRTADTHWARPVLQEMEAPDPAMRYEAARAAGEIVLHSAVGRLIGLLDDRDSEVRQVAIWALGQIGGTRARRAIEACRASPDEAIREAADEALSELDFASAPLDMFVFDTQEGEGATRSSSYEPEPDED